MARGRQPSWWPPFSCFRRITLLHMVTLAKLVAKAALVRGCVQSILPATVRARNRLGRDSRGSSAMTEGIGPGRQRIDLYVRARFIW